MKLKGNHVQTMWRTVWTNESFRLDLDFKMKGPWRLKIFYFKDINFSNSPRHTIIAVYCFNNMRSKKISEKVFSIIRILWQ